MKKTSQKVLSHFFASKPKESNASSLGNEGVSSSKILKSTNGELQPAGKSVPPVPKAQSSAGTIPWKPRGLPGGPGSTRGLQQEFSYTPAKRSSSGVSSRAASERITDDVVGIGASADILEDADNIPRKRRYVADAEGQADILEARDEEKKDVGSVSWQPPQPDPNKRAQFIDKLVTRHDSSGNAAERYYGKPPPAGRDAKYTPLEQQVVELKIKFPDVLLMVEVGYKYRFFGEDAETAAKILGIFAHYDHNFLTASIPTFRLHVHVRRLVEAGYKVGVVRQTETAAIKAHGSNRSAPFTRNLSALYTRATLEAAEDLGGISGQDDAAGKGRLSSYLMCIVEEGLDSGSRRKARTSIGKEGSRRQSVENLSQEKGARSSEAKEKKNYDTTLGVVAVETATGDVMFGHFEDTVMRSALESRLIGCSPAELLIATPLSSATEKLLTEYAGTNDIRVERVNRDRFKDGGALSEVTSFYESKRHRVGSEQSAAENLGAVRSAESKEQQDRQVDEGLQVVVAMPDLVLQALALALDYLKQFGLANVLRLGANFRPFSGANEMSLCPNALQQLEILKNSMDGNEKGSLLWLMDHTSTAFGGRLLRHWVSHPLCDQGLIEARLEAVTELGSMMGSTCSSLDEGSFPSSGRGGGMAGYASRGGVAGKPGASGSGQSLVESVLLNLKKTADVERGITRIFHRTATPAEFVTVMQALSSAAKHLARLNNDNATTVQAPLLRKLLSAASSCGVVEKAAWLLSAVDTEAAMKGDRLQLFVCAGGRFPKVASCRTAIRMAEKQLEELLPELRRTLRMPRLEYMSIMGTEYVIEVPVNQKVPSDWIKVNSTKQKNRFHPPQVLRAFDSLALAREQLQCACREAWNAFLADFSEHYVEFRNAVQALAALDCLHSLAIVSRNQGYVRPEFIAEGSPQQLIIKDGRHPVLEATMGEGFVPNDTSLAGAKERCQIITGPNMGGKSVYIRQVALIAIMAQIGSYVPASSAKMSVMDSVLTRMGSSDNVARGRSTFLEELGEASAILGNATWRSLVILDELGRGTSTHDGVAIAYATLYHLLTETRCLTLFVTHYPAIAEVKHEFPGDVGAYYVSYLAEEPHVRQLAGSDQSATGTRTTEAGGGSDDVAEAESLSVVEESQQRITFLYKLVPGVSPRSFGLHVARLAEIPETAVKRAAEMAAKLQAEVTARQHSRSQHLSLSGLPLNLPVEGMETDASISREPGTASDEGGASFTEAGDRCQMEDKALTCKLRGLLQELDNDVKIDNWDEARQSLSHLQETARAFS